MDEITYPCWDISYTMLVWPLICIVLAMVDKFDEFLPLPNLITSYQAEYQLSEFDMNCDIANTSWH